ncbi:MAG: YlxR family protein [Eubacteriales bacterium]|nr:YlxR family protein [Eubacteriales bacterium]MDD4389803.1 YlxR family protein [Eubacteriales bacterium]
MKAKKSPMRRCAGCGESKEKKSLIRIAGYEDEISIDPTGRAKGRGVYLCVNNECLEKAHKRKAIGRSLGIEMTNERYEALFEEIKKYEKQI